MPPFTVYKGKNLYHTWTEGGPKGAYYGVSESGWMQDFNFEAWFISSFCAHVAEFEKPVCLMFDGHNSHLTYNTVKHAIAEKIVLLCLPPHSSHALQALDVGVFKSLKSQWTKVLQDHSRISRHENVDKTVFPKLLAKLWPKLDAQPVINGFRACGLVPVDRQAVQNKIVGSTSQNFSSDSSPRKLWLKAIQDIVTPPSDPPLRKNRKRIQHQHGEILTEESSIERRRLEEEARAAKTVKKPLKKTTKKSCKKQITYNDVEDAASDGVPGANVGDDGEDGNDSVTVQESSTSHHEAIDLSKLEENVSMVIVRYERSFYPGLVTEINGMKIKVKCMERCGQKTWKWPRFDDLEEYKLRDLIQVISDPEMLNSRQIFNVPELNKYLGES